MEERDVLVDNLFDEVENLIQGLLEGDYERQVFARAASEKVLKQLLEEEA